MRKTKEFNNISPKLKARIPKFPKTGKVVFQVCGITTDPLTKKLKIPLAHLVPAQDRVYDPGHDDYVDIAAIERVQPNGVIDFYDMWLRREALGNLVLYGNRRADVEQYEYLCLCNYNESNPDRDPDTPAIFRMLDEGKKAKSVRELRKVKLEAMNLATGMTGTEARDFAHAKGWTESELPVLRNRVENFAENSPKDFLELYKNRDKTIRANLHKAQIQKIINYDGRSRKFSWVSNGEEICKIPMSTKDKLDGLTSFVLSGDRGQRVYGEICSLLKVKNTQAEEMKGTE